MDYCQIQKKDERDLTMKKILLLGSSGFIGLNLKEYLINFKEEYQLFTPSSRDLDLTKESMVYDYLKEYKFDVVIHAAVCNPRRLAEGTIYHELDSDLRMFFNLERYHELFGKMLYFGSGAEYDKSENISSVNETVLGNGVPKNEYGLAKYIIGKQIEQSRNIYNLRIFGLYGKYENWRTTFISGACCKAIKNLPITIRQNVYFDYLYIDDFCNLVKWFIDNKPNYHTYNMCSGKKIDLLSIAEKVKSISGKDIPIYVCKEGFAKEYTADNQRLLLETSNTIFIDIDLGIQLLYRYYESISKDINIIDLLYQ